MDFKEAYPDTCSTVAAAVVSGNIKLLKRLIRTGKAVDVKDNRGWQPIHEAAFHGNIACLKEILKCEVDVDSRTFEEQTALMLACKNGHPECVSYLLKSGADPNSITNEDFSPLWEASIKGCLECMRLVLRAGADVNRRSYTLDTALHWVIQHRDDSNALPLVKCLVEAGTSLTIQNECGLTPVFIAAQFRRTMCLQYLLECANLKGDIFTRELVNKAAEDNATPLYLATQNENVDCIKILLQNGANANLGVYLDKTNDSELIIIPFQLALYKHNKECVKILLPVTNLDRFTWEINHFCPETGFNYNPVAIAASLNTEDCLRLLLDHPFFSGHFTGEKNINYLSEKNIFSFETKIRPAVLLAKKFRPFLEESFRRNPLSLHRCFRCIMKNASEYFPVVLLMLRLGINVDFPRFWLDHVSMCLEYFCAMLKYTVKENGMHNMHKLLDENSFVGKTLVKHPIIRKLQSYLTTHSVTVKREDMLREKLGGKFKSLVNPEQGKIASLQGICRRRVFLQLILNSTFSQRSVYTLDIPKQIQTFLLFEEDLTFSNAVTTAFENIEIEEDNINKLFDDIHL